MLKESIYEKSITVEQTFDDLQYLIACQKRSNSWTACNELVIPKKKILDIAVIFILSLLKLVLLRRSRGEEKKINWKECCLKIEYAQKHIHQPVKTTQENMEWIAVANVREVMK